MISPAQRLHRTSLQFFAVINEKIKQLKDAGNDVIRLDIGSPDLPPAPHIINTLIESASNSSSHGYQPHSGSTTYIRAWCDWYKTNYEVDIDSKDEIIPLLGSKEGIFHMMQAFVNPGDVVLIPDPGYLTYTQGTYINEGEPYYLSLTPSNSYLPEFKLIPENVARKAKLLWINYPNNPTAAVAPYSFFEEAVDFAKSYNILICHDAAYNFVTFDGYEAPSILQVPGAKDIAVEFNTLSKSHNMAGWRIGAALGNSKALQALYLVKTNADSGHFLPIHEAATAALQGDQSWIVDRNQIYKERRDIVVATLRKVGLEVESPRASIYVWSPIPPGWNSSEFALELLNNTQVSVAPGIIFGQNSDSFIRIALTDATDRIEEAMVRIRKFLG